MSRVTRVLVLVPARDEAGCLGPCLDAVAGAVEQLAASTWAAPVVTTVVLDGWAAGTDEVLAVRSWVHTHQVDLGVVGAVRAAGVAAVLGRLPPLPAEHVWLAHTDADSLVPADWLTTQLALAEQGADLVLGSVEPDPRDLPAQVHRRWRLEHALGEGHPGVHGANLGIRLRAYEQVGGFRALPLHEDVDLVRRVRASGWPTVSTDRGRVLTSGRRSGRVAGGFADYLRTLERGPAAADGAR